MRLLFGLLLLVCLPFASLATPAGRGEVLALALDAAAVGNWRAAMVAARPTGPEGRDLIDWLRLRQGGQADFDAYRDFLSRRPDWPGLDLLRTRGEGSIPEEAVPAEVIAYFNGDLPETGTGVLRLVDAYLALGQTGDAEATAVMAWRTRTLTAETEDALLERFGKVLADSHASRLDDLLWRGQESAARRNIARAPEGWSELAEARLALADRAPGVDAKISAVPDALQEDAGLAYERFIWRARKGRHDEAIALINARSRSPEALGRPEEWSNWRRIYARRALRDGNAEEAYALASRHFLVGGASFADLEWLAGYIALRHLNDPELALLHFDRFEAAVQTPISLGRAGYWRGRAFDAMGDAAAAKEAYTLGAKHQTSFYGLLAAEAAGLPMDPTLDGSESFPPLEDSPLRGNSVLVAGLLLLDAGDLALSERFLTHLVESLDREQAGTLASLMLSLDQPHIALMIAKRATQNQIVLPAAYFPLSPLMERDLPVARDLALAIARRESEFDPVVVSPAGARGLMQLMPGTARDVSGVLEISYDRDALTADPAYNVTLGTAYLAGLIERFGPAPVLVSVGYNAGPGRSTDWMEDRGDPRNPDVDIVDWIEMIPFRETRNYVMRVTESIMVYRARLNGTQPNVPMTEFLHKG
ncbi:lytic transglycosylase domain-containing protein [Tropicimonas sp. IMCC6043]|uniref:lytic transglycosylase domain-containing protein n=1 Tax=Tropicimonas sp. IMCC6043 TaxID=2510645 RepID=UPI00101DDDA2|nr:lytic transglycosylase domain-containing protein [Tropicimonas sp. IMCC6043]RYH09916.1 lytic transglycosylase domain-containing protein [Tropicimonas sp. IMCC6043]